MDLAAEMYAFEASAGNTYPGVAQVLIIRRKTGERILIGDDIQVEVVVFDSVEVSLRIVAPFHLRRRLSSATEWTPEEEIDLPADQTDVPADQDVVTLRHRDRIEIGSDLTVILIRIGPNNVALGIEAPLDRSVRREELG